MKRKPLQGSNAGIGTCKVSVSSYECLSGMERDIDGYLLLVPIFVLFINSVLWSLTASVPTMSQAVYCCL